MMILIFFFQIHSDFVQASTRGAMAAIDGMLTPLNPGDEPKYERT